MAYRSKGFLGDTNIGVFKLGDSDVKLYLGDMLVYPLSQGIFNIMCDSATYDGTLQVAQNIVVTDESGNTLIENVDYTVTENNGGTNVGSYPIIIRLMGQYQGTASGEFVIDKADSLLSFDISDIGVKTGGTKSNIVRVKAGDGAISYTSNDTSVVTVDNNGNVNGVATGDTTVVAVIEETQNYKSASTMYNVTAYDANWHVTAKINVTDTTNPTKIIDYVPYGCRVEIDGVVQSSVTTGYTFNTTGEHIIRYKVGYDGYTYYDYVVNCFNGCKNLINVLISDDIKAITELAFSGCSGMESCIIGDGVVSIDRYAFSSCTSLTSITIPDSVTSIGEYAFVECSGLTSVTIGDGVTSISRSVFQNCKSLASVTIGSNVTSIDIQVFYGCRSLTSIGPVGSGASLEIPTGVTIIDRQVFSYCTSLTSVTIPNSITSIGEYAFAGCGLINIEIPDNVTSIGDDALSRCVSLTSITIGSGITSIGNSAFFGCNSLTSATCKAITPPELGEGAFYDTNNCPIYVPVESVEAYKTTTTGHWSSYKRRIQAIP